MRRFVLYILLLASSYLLGAERHEIRLGVGDAWLDTHFYEKNTCSGYDLLFGCMSPQEMEYAIVGMPAQEADVFLRNHLMAERSKLRTTGNIFVDYQFHLTGLLSLGADLNVLPFWQDYTIRNGYYEIRGQFTTGNVLLSVIPRLRFTYLRLPFLRLYSGIGIGATIKFGLPAINESWATNCQPINTDRPVLWAGTADLTLIGLAVGGRHFFASAEVSPMFHLGYPSLDWFVAGGRMLKVAVGYRF